MDKTFEILGNVIGGIGILICLAAGLTRVLGSHWIYGYETVTLFICGIALMLMACLAKLQAIALQLNRRS